MRSAIYDSHTAAVVESELIHSPSRVSFCLTQPLGTTEQIFLIYVNHFGPLKPLKDNTVLLSSGKADILKYLYFTSGPLHWGDTYEACGAAKQSPIDIPYPTDLQYDANLGAFNFTGYSDLEQADLSIKNNGHTGRYKTNFLNPIVLRIAFLPFVVH